MTAEEYQQWQHELAVGYAAEKVRAGNWPEEGAYDRALADSASRLPDGLGTEGMLLLAGEVDGSLVGRLWIGLTHPAGVADCAFIYDIDVIEARRGEGLGRALLTAGEEAARARGAAALELNVFGANPVAAELYRTSGYRVVSQQMRKDLRKDADAPVAAAPEAIRRAAAAYDRAAFAGDPGSLTGAERDLATLEADLYLSRAKLAHARLITGTGDHSEESSLLDRALTLYRGIGDVRGEAEALCWIGIYHQFVLNDDPAALPYLRRAADLAPDPLLRSYALRHLGIAAHHAGDLPEARALLEESTTLRREAGFIIGVAANLVGLIYLAAAEGRDTAPLITEARELATEAGATSILAQVEEAAAQAA
ncbi:acetyltransferase (GNAT) family protein [Actinoplanes italicus]|uniref:Acetyltransferase (GNAT) family protein n=2 Tax=Actinoplanes italicus TaxID=113567 RepID=A0A2T0JWC0_9ACTN|nr:acetyltransferase (GNAT) family protein [Actinoplanes italicus]